MGMLNDFIEARLIRFRDIKSFVGYYVRVMDRNKKVFEDFMKEYQYPSAMRLFEHFRRDEEKAADRGRPRMKRSFKPAAPVPPT
jgi:hypothetical protein